MFFEVNRSKAEAGGLTAHREEISFQRFFMISLYFIKVNFFISNGFIWGGVTNQPRPFAPTKWSAPTGAGQSARPVAANALGELALTLRACSDGSGELGVVSVAVDAHPEFLVGILLNASGMACQCAKNPSSFYTRTEDRFSLSDKPGEAPSVNTAIDQM
jgi:hypothetical protein